MSGDWWNPSLWGLEQWDLVAYAQERGQLYWCVMRDLMQGCWQMAALSD
jgi:protein ImuB